MSDGLQEQFEHSLDRLHIAHNLDTIVISRHISLRSKRTKHHQILEAPKYRSYFDEIRNLNVKKSLKNQLVKSFANN